MKARFLHTADWQVGKTFHSITDHAKREVLRRQRLQTIRGLKGTIDEQQLDFVVVCGDLFDSATPDQPTVSVLCSAVGSLKIPIYAIPGNHDHGGPGCIWEQEFFIREKEQLAPNFHILLEPKPLVLDNAILLPCPLLRRHESTDPTTWLRTEPEGLPDNRPRVVLAHGSTQGFSSSGETDDAASINRIDLDQLPPGKYDYVALGDWHGLKKVGPAVWFSGTPEQDRFAKGESNQPGYVCIVEIEGQGKVAEVIPEQTGSIGWHSLDDFHVINDADLDTLESQLGDLLGQQTNRDLLRLSIQGTLSFAGIERFEKMIERLQARLIRVDLDHNLQTEPSEEEIKALTERQDPLIASVARELRDSMEADPLAREALRELQLQIRKAEA